MNLIRTKTFWVGLVIIATGVIEGVFDGDWSAAMEKILAGLLVITGRDAISKIGANG